MKLQPVGALLLPGALLLWGCASATPRPPAQAAGGASATAPAGFDPGNPLTPTMLMREGRALVGEGRVAEGLERYWAAARLQPDNPTIHNLIGQAELRRGESIKALESFNRALTLAPTYSDARNNRGAAYVAIGQLSQAETDFLSTLADNTYANRAGVYFNLGALYVARGNLAAAEENLRRAATPAGPVEAYVLLGRVQQRLGKLELAESAWRNAVERAPERVDAAMLLAAFLESQGRRDEAEKLYRRVIELGPGTPEAAEARAKLRK